MIGKTMIVAALLAAMPTTNAPADRYFGRLQMSTLRIRYETMQLRKRYESHQLYPDQAQHLLDLTADAFNAWARAYPHDMWLSSTGFLIAQLYADLPGGIARARAVALFTYVKAHFPSTRYAAQSRTMLHRGVPLRPTPAWALHTPSPSPAPSALPSIPSTALPSASPKPSTAPSPAAL
jgi:hypothetical protein